jgi:hypothetical protein
MNEIKSIHNKTLIAALAVAAATTLSSQADLLFDRGLPTSNLNNIAGANRSNIGWADSEATATPSEYWLGGDSFTLGGAGTYQVDTIRLWMVGSSSNLTLLGGLNGDPVSAISSIYAASSVTYGNASTYQKNAGDFLDLYQVDFTVNLTLNAGQLYNFFVETPWSFVGTDDYRQTPLHSTNAALSGSTQEGADGTFLWLHVDGLGQGVETWESGTGAGTSGFPSGWDKNTDANVQVFGSAVPEPSSVAMLSGALLLLSSRRALRRKQQHA